MTKPFVPEFTNRLDAIAYIHAGRGGKLERPTKDSWNTKVVQPKATDEIVLMLADEPLIHWWWNVAARQEMVTITKVPNDFTARKRMNDYLLKPRGLEIATDNAIVGTVGSAMGNSAKFQLIPGRIGMLTSPTVMDPDNTFASLAPATVRWSKTELANMAKTWAQATYEALKVDTWTEVDFQPLCIECSSVSPITAIPLSNYTHNFEHLFAHAVGREFNLELLTNLMRTSATDINIVASGAAKTYGRIGEANPHLEKYMSDRMFSLLHHASGYAR